jgi:hypothetical protein
MEITKEVLQDRLDGMTQELGILLEQASEVRGAIMLCGILMEHLESEDEEEDSTSSSEEQNG